MTTLDGLNDAQLAAALETEGAVLVTAGAGSGKTRLLTHRIAHIVRDLNVDPYNVLAITFTNKAADEMKNRIYALIGETEIWISTFHSMCAKILRRFSSKLGYSSNFTIYAQDESERAIKQITKDLDYADDSFYKKAVRCISDAKSRGLTPEGYANENAFLPDTEDICKIYQKYEETLASNNAMDFDDLLLKTLDLFENYSDVLEHYQHRFKYIHVDEFQDTNSIQYDIVRMLAGGYGNLFVVGDEDQSIYGWRGADVTNMQRFVEDFGAKIFKLERNYRSTENILKAANNLIKNNVSRIDKNLWSDLGRGESVVAYRANDESGEADYIVNTINKLMRNNGYRPHDFAVLMRINALSSLIEKRFIRYNIPYKVYGGFKFYDRKEVKDVIAYLRILSNHADDEAIMRVINFPKRGIGDKTVQALRDYCANKGLNLFEVLINIENSDLAPLHIKKLKPFGDLLKSLAEYKTHATISELTEKLIKDADIKKAYAEDTEENTTRKLNIDQFISSVRESEKNRGGSLEDFLEEVTLYTEGDEESSDSVFLSTVHSAKGMEFRCVFIIGTEEGLFPLSRATDETDDLEEERRLMYVAITRAKERLFLTYCSSRYIYGEPKYVKASRFFEEIDPSFASSQMAKSDYDSKQRFSYNTNAPKYSDAPKIGGVAGQNSAVKRDNSIKDYTIGTRVMHKKFGEGVVVGITNIGLNSYIEINFDSVGKMTLSLAFAPITKL